MAKCQSLISFKSLCVVIQKEKEFEKIREIAEYYNIVEEFHKIFPELKEIAKPKKVDKQTLYLMVVNSVWKNELNFHKKILIEKINKYFSKEVIKTIKFL